MNASARLDDSQAVDDVDAIPCIGSRLGLPMCPERTTRMERAEILWTAIVERGLNYNHAGRAPDGHPETWEELHARIYPEFVRT